MPPLTQEMRSRKVFGDHLRNKQISMALNQITSCEVDKADENRLDWLIFEMPFTVRNLIQRNIYWQVQDGLNREGEGGGGFTCRLSVKISLLCLVVG